MLSPIFETKKIKKLKDKQKNVNNVLSRKEKEKRKKQQQRQEHQLQSQSLPKVIWNLIILLLSVEEQTYFAWNPISKTVNDLKCMTLLRKDFNFYNILFSCKCLTQNFWVTLKWIVTRQIEITCLSPNDVLTLHEVSEILKMISITAAKQGKIKIFQWIKKKSKRFYEKWYLEKKSKNLTCQVALEAARFGRSSLLKWLRKQKCPWNEEVCAAAASGGHRKLLKWATKKGCPWDFRMCVNAALRGDLEILKWIREHKKNNESLWESNVCLAAAKGGHLEILKWLRSQIPPCPWDWFVCTEATRNGHFEILKWAYEQGCPNHFRTIINIAAERGYLNILQWTNSQGCFFTEETCQSAAKGGHLEILKWLKSSQVNAPWDEKTCNEAARMGHFEVLKWVRSQNCPYDYELITNAALSQHLEMLIWACTTPGGDDDLFFEIDCCEIVKCVPSVSPVVVWLQEQKELCDNCCAFVRSQTWS